MPTVTSNKSEMPSLSESANNGFVIKPSVPSFNSSPSSMPSLSLSLLLTSVPALYSSNAETLSPSASSKASIGSLASKPFARS